MTTILSKQAQRSAIISITIGGLIEWYELFLYVYWAPLIAHLFFHSSSELTALIHTLLVFAIGFLSRPLGGLFFGHLGDRYGRKASLVSSIIMITVPTFIIGLLPTYSQIGMASPIILGIMRLLQGFPAGGELPGAMCYLAEISQPGRRRYMCSYAFFGAQLGAIISMAECLLLEKYLSQEDLIRWGWRLSFLIGGVLGLFGLYLRHRLRETPLFQHLEKELRVLHKPIFESFHRYSKKLVLGFFYSILEVVGYFMLTIFPAIYFEKIFGLSATENLIITIILLTLSVATLPFFGMLGDRFRNKKLLIGSAIGIILLSFPFYLSVEHASLTLAIIFELILIFFLNIQFALLPALLSELFPTTVRYTCVGLSFNVCDSVIGGLAPVLALYLIERTADIGSFIIVFASAALISLFAFCKLKEKSGVLTS